MNNRNIYSGNFGIEKENIRVDNKGRISKLPHSKIFGENNPYITRDFSESQIEIITSAFDTIEKAFNELHNITHVVLNTLDNELLWPQSNPPIIEDEKEIEIANYEKETKRVYRNYLSNKYGKKKAIISGIHFNISFSDDYLLNLFNNQTSFNEINDFKNNLYLKITKYFLNEKWLFTELFSASPVFHESYVDKCIKKASLSKTNDYLSCELISLRNSECGYRNTESLYLDYSNIEEYNKSLKYYIDNKIIISESEIYSPIRIKKDALGNISYIELRFIDINPLYFNGVSLNDLKLIHMFFMYFSKLDDFYYSIDLQKESDQNNFLVNYFEKNMDIVNYEKEKLLLKGIKLLNNLKNFSSKIKGLPYNYEDIIDSAILRLKENDKSYYNIIKNEIDKSNYVDYHLEIANKHKNYAINNPLLQLGYEGLELSTKILLQSAIKLGYKYEILDREENFISLTDLNGKTEYIKQATKTSLDNYSSVLIMENKSITKKILRKNNIKVPNGYTITCKKEGIELFEAKLLPKNLVIKPNNTNFGLGITIFKEKYTKKDYLDALDFAFIHDKTVLIEEFIEGLEYRFIVIDGKVEGILHRKPANVLGNGKNTIKELIKIKNNHPYRGFNYTSPLEIIKTDEIVINFLKAQKLNIESIPKENELVYLRENSNISTGGDSISVTEYVDKSYFYKVIDAVNALNVKIAGVDVLIKDIKEQASDTNYAIIELNFNPAIHIHCYPLEGTKEDIGDKLILAIFK